MSTVRVVFTEPQTFGGVTVQEVTVRADRLVLMDGGDVTLDVAAGVVRSLDDGPEAHGARLRAAHRNHGRSWTDAEYAELRRLWADMGMKELEEHFGRSQNAVTSAARRLRLPERAALRAQRGAGQNG